MTANPEHPGPLLVVDDDRLVLLTLVHALRQAGHEVIEADNGDEAILLARRLRPRLAVLDIRMQGLSGFDVAQYLRDYSKTPFLFLSAFTDPSIREQARSLGAVDCLNKPVDMAVLLSTIEQALRQPPSSIDGDRGASDETLPGGWPVEALAVGLLMQRETLDRDAGYRRLLALAQAQDRSAAAMAETLLQEQEALRGAPPVPPR